MLLVCPSCAELAAPLEAFCEACGSPLTRDAARLRARAILVARRGSARPPDLLAAAAASASKTGAGA